MAVDSLMAARRVFRVLALFRLAVAVLVAFAFGYAVGVAQCVQLVTAFFDEGSR